MKELSEQSQKDKAREALKTISMLPEGRELLDAIFSKCEHGKESLHVPGCSDQTAFKLGRQSLANWLAGLTSYKPERK
jgi:hypothetical protein